MSFYSGLTLNQDNALQQRGQMVALMGIGGGDVQFLDIAFLIGAGMLFVTDFVEAVFLCPTGIFVFTRCGLQAELRAVSGDVGMGEVPVGGEIGLGHGILGFG